MNGFPRFVVEWGVQEGEEEEEQEEEETESVSSSVALRIGCLTATRAAGDLRPRMVAKGEGARRGEGQEAADAEEERWGGRWLVVPLLGGRQVLEERKPMAVARLLMRSRGSQWTQKQARR